LGLTLMRVLEFLGENDSGRLNKGSSSDDSGTRLRIGKNKKHPYCLGVTQTSCWHSCFGCTSWYLE